MKSFKVVHLGLGNVGKRFAEVVFKRQSYLKKKYQVDLKYTGAFSSTKGITNPAGLVQEDIEQFDAKAQEYSIAEILKEADEHTILVDTSASSETIPYMKQVLEKGGFVVLSNKKALTDTTQEYIAVVDAYPGRVLYNTTVGAGLPILRMIRNLIDAGDEIISIEGCFSGTLGFLCTSLEKGLSYSEAIRKAKEQGFTEPDPRDDLSGIDVARKALICARLMGKQMEMSQIDIEPFYSEQFKDLSVDEFLDAISTEDDYYRMQFKYANDESKTLRYVACIKPESVSIELKAVSRQSPLGSIRGPETIAVITTKWYQDNPLVIQGPGAGKNVTAAGVFADVLSVILPSQ